MRARIMDPNPDRLRGMESRSSLFREQLSTTEKIRKTFHLFPFFSLLSSRGSAVYSNLTLEA